MKEKHPIDSFFKESLADRQYPMKEEYWSAAADLIEAQGGRKRRRFLWLFLLIGLLITGSTLGYYFSRDTAKKLKPNTEIASTFEVDANEKESPENALLDKGRGNEPVEVEVEKIEREPALPAASFPINRVETSKANSLLSKTQPANSGSEKSFIETEETNPNPTNRVLDLLELEQSELLAAREDRGVGLDLKKKEQKSEYKARVLNERAFELEEQDQSNPSFRYLSRAARSKHQWGLDLGFALNKGIKDPTSSGQSLGMSPVIGISYRRRFNAQLEFISGLRYTQMPALTGDSTFLSTDFSFGAQVEGINIKALSLHQAEIPLQLAWYTGPRSKIVGGAYFRYLINVQSEVSRFESNPFESTPGPVNRAWGYKQGFSDLDYGLQLGYFYHLSEGLQIGLETQYGLKDVRDNAFYRINSFDRNLNARIILRYHFLN
ncbi:MAG: outer membrane beta-barrel protein [Bacteroidia bacterium]|nr:outer membrane beta-barrel protein [Bacteroidia bacterium]